MRRGRVFLLSVATSYLFVPPGQATQVHATAALSAPDTGGGYATYRGSHTGIIVQVNTEHRGKLWAMEGRIEACTYFPTVVAECHENGIAGSTPQLICESQTDLWCQSGHTKYKGVTDAIMRVQETYSGEISDRDQTGCARSDCPQGGSVQWTETAAPGSPIVIDLGRAGLDLTPLRLGVMFDLDSDGIREHMAWTSADAADAFLVLDRNGDGAITNGRELFGDYSPQPLSREPNGYEALAVFDSPGSGGDGNGVITSADSIWPSLRLWVDASHDGISDALELTTLSAAGIDAVSFDFVRSASRDRYGNLFRFKSKVSFSGPSERHSKSVDVFFLTE